MTDTRLPLDTASGILNLEGWKATAYRETDTEIHVDAEPTPPDLTEPCYGCGLPTIKVRFGQRIQELVDIPVHGKRVVIHLKRHRYRCQNEECGYTFVVFNEHMHDSRMMTDRLAKYISKQAFKEPFLNVAHRVGVDKKTVRTLFAEELRRRDDGRTIETPRILGIDELFLGKQYRCILVDLEKRKPIELLETRTKKAVTRFLLTLDRDTVQLVAMDMWNPYREAVQDALPNAQIIVDRFHINRMANDALETVRKRVHWHREVFNYFDAGEKVTNAYTEALNGLMKLVNKRGRGYSFPVARAKLLYGIKE